MPKRRRTASILITAVLILLGSCSGKPQQLHILTDRPELASAVELYDAARDDLTITLRQVRAIDASAIGSEEPDLILGADLAADEIISLLKPLDMSLINRPTYPALIGLTDSESNPYLLPLSFKLPMIIGSQSTMAKLPDHATVSPEELRAAAAEHNRVDGNGVLVQMGFSPSWNPMSFVDLLNVRYPLLLERGIENLDGKEIESVITEAADWIIQAAGDPESDTAFNKKYRYIPDESLILQGRIAIARTDFSAWAALPDALSSKLDIRYLRGDRYIPVDTITAAGIPKSSRNRRNAEAFLSWLSEESTQEILMKRWEREGVSVFGFLGGLSANPMVNESIIAARYPRMSGMIPEGHYLAAPERIPHRWRRISTEVLAPWLSRAAANPQQAGTLADAYRTWDLSSLEETD